jgi:hypothetical protein
VSPRRDGLGELEQLAVAGSRKGWLEPLIKVDEFDLVSRKCNGQEKCVEEGRNLLDANRKLH